MIKTSTIEETKLATIEVPDLRTCRKDLRAALIWGLKALETEKKARAIWMAMQYYGLVGPAKTLHAIGQEQAKPLTRERVRQIIDEVVTRLQKKEKLVDYQGARPFEMVKEWFGAHGLKEDRSYVPLTDLLAWPAVANYRETRGLSAFLKDAKIRQLVYKNAKFLYVSPEKRKGMLQEIQAKNRQLRQEETKKKKQSKIKTVTYVPQTVREALDNLSSGQELSLNHLYELILTEFGRAKPWQPHQSFFEKTQSWRFRKEKSSWVQIGLYIDKQCYIDAQEYAQSAKASVMAYIARALAWGTSDDPSATTLRKKLQDKNE
jgi:hypothetical protein